MLGGYGWIYILYVHYFKGYLLKSFLPYTVKGAVHYEGYLDILDYLVLFAYLLCILTPPGDISHNWN